MGCGTSKDLLDKNPQNPQKLKKTKQQRLQSRLAHFKHIQTPDQLTGIQQLIPLQILTSQLNFKIVFDEPYAHETTYENLTTIKNKYQNCNYLCLASVNLLFHEQILEVACFDVSAQEVFKPTFSSQQAQETRKGNFFYFSINQSFGFAPNKSILLDSSDQYDKNDKQRMSWLLNGVGGGRSGNNFVALDNVNKFRKLILVA